MDRAGLEDEHVKNFELLPWLANGTLGEVERERVLAHTANCAECQQELLVLDEWHSDFSDARLAPTPTPNLERIRGRIEQTDRGFGWLHGSWWRPAAVGSAVAAAALAAFGVWNWDRPHQDADYVTVSVPMRSGQIQVLFEADITASAQKELLQRLDLQVVSGPTATGKYVLEPGPKSPPDFAIQLQEAPGVAFASDPVSLE